MGNLGAGKSLYGIRTIINDTSGKKTYSNIAIKDCPNAVYVTPDMMFIRTETSDKNKFKYEFNQKFWESQKKPLNLFWDEIHLSGGNSRRSSSSINLAFSKFIAMGRRISGMDEYGNYGILTYSAQSERTIDVNLKELCNEIIFCIGHWELVCLKCNMGINSTSEMQTIDICRICGSWQLKKENYYIEIFKFKNWDNYFRFRMGVKGKFHFERFIIEDAVDYFSRYDTLSMKGLWETFSDENAKK